LSSSSNKALDARVKPAHHERGESKREVALQPNSETYPPHPDPLPASAGLSGEKTARQVIHLIQFHCFEIFDPAG
jgi:hypothetical protein